jgi:hypothetical protein
MLQSRYGDPAVNAEDGAGANQSRTVRVGMRTEAFHAASQAVLSSVLLKPGSL